MALRIGANFDEQYEEFKKEMRAIQRILVGTDGTGGIYAISASRSLTWQELANVLSEINKSRVAMDVVEGLGPDFIQFVKDQERDQTFDVAADYAAMKSALTEIGTAIFNALSGAALVTVSQTGVPTHRSYTTAQTAALRDLIDAYRPTVTLT